LLLALEKIIFEIPPCACHFLFSGAVGGKTGKTSVLPRFSKIEGGGGSGGGAQQWWSYLARARAPQRRCY
jgi:hypothetical protein